MTSESSIPESLSLAVGQQQEIRLRSLGTSGYVWTARSDSECVEVSRTRSRSGAATDAVGASLDEIVVVHALSPGRAIVRLEQRRPWAPHDDPQSSAVIEITVTA
jgi:predicted secreted protein